jgi:carbon-monoxide dehydrogenase medium subunit
MKPAPFEYHRADSVEHAVALLTDLGDEAKVLAGGQSLIPLMNFRLARPAHLVDINRLSELADVATADGWLEVGALVRQRHAERSATVLAEAPLLASALGQVGHPAIRNRGTVGGSLAHADPAAELPTVLRVLDGEVVARSSRGTRVIPSEALCEGFLTTSLSPDELLVSVRLPRWPPRSGWAFVEFSRRSGDFAIVGVAAAVTLRLDGQVDGARLALSGVGATPVRAAGAEALLTGVAPSPQAWAEAAARAAADIEPSSDIHGSAAYRRQLARVLTTRALAQAYDRAREAG